MGVVWLVARREVTTRIRERSFLVSSAITLLALLAVVTVPRFVGGTTSFDLAVAGPASTAIVPALEAAGTSADVRVRVRFYSDDQAARAAVRGGHADAALLDGDTVVSDREPDPRLAAVLTAAHRDVSAQARLAERGLDPAAVSEALDVPPLRMVALPGTGTDEDTDVRKGIAFVAVIILFGQLALYGAWVAFGVVEEKSSRVVELLLATLRPWQLLAGKILGIGTLALGQLVLVTGVALATAVGVGTVSLPVQAFGTLGQVFLWFVLGYAFFSSAYAAAACRVSRQEELSNVTGPMAMVLVGSYLVGLYAVQQPKGLLAQVASVVPPVSAITMPTRAAVVPVPGWQVASAIVLMVAATAALVWLSGRIYAGAILRTGARVGFREALRGSREPSVPRPTSK
jgi:ABC-type Na+ efflux pump, permease component